MDEQTLSTDMLRALALMQYNDEEYFILPLEEGGIKVYEGTEEQARKDFEADVEGTDDPATDGNFEIYCSNNLIEVEEFDPDDYNNDYLVLTDEEADEKVAEEIKESLWAFNASFILGECGLDYSGEQSLQDMQAKSCEGANDFILSLVERTCGLESFVEAAVSADGRGHFLSRYDGNETEETVEDQTFYIYRIN